MVATEPIVVQFPPRWYAAYTTPRHEKSAHQHLESRNLESFLPLYDSARMWNGRRAVVQMLANRNQESTTRVGFSLQLSKSG